MPPERPGRKTVVAVDDEPGYADLIAEFVERWSAEIEVVPVDSGSACLSALAARDVDCVVSDYDMTEMDGLDLLEAVRERDPALPFVLFTGRGSEEVASEAISAGVTDYLQKGMGTEQYALLANRIEHAIEERRNERRYAESRRRFQRLLENLPGMVYRCRNETGWPMQQMSAYCDNLTGYDASALEAGEVSYGRDVVHPADQDPVWEAVQDAVADDEPFRLEYRIVTADGDVTWVWEQGRRIEDGPEGVELLEGFITDVSEHSYRSRQSDGVRETHRVDG